MNWWSNRKQSQDLQISIMYIPPTSSGVVLPLLNHAGEECHPSFRSVALLAVNQLHGDADELASFAEVAHALDTVFVDDKEHKPVFAFNVGRSLELHSCRIWLCPLSRVSNWGC